MKMGITTGTPSRHAAGAERDRALDEALARLPPDYAAVILLYDIEGLSGPDVASAMERSRGAIHMLRARALSLLVSFLGRESNYFTSVE